MPTRNQKRRLFTNYNKGSAIPPVEFIVADSNAVATRVGTDVVLDFSQGVIEFNVISNLGAYQTRNLFTGGAGQGGSTTNGGAGGGAAAEGYEFTMTPAVQLYTGYLGKGGRLTEGGPIPGVNGENTTIFGITFLGGPGGGNGQGPSGGSNRDGKSGPSSSGSGYTGGTRVGNCIVGKGFNGGLSLSGADAGAGGGGREGAAADATGQNGTAGGLGFTSDITGTPKKYCYGGGGGAYRYLTGTAIGGDGQDSTYGKGGSIITGVYQEATEPTKKSGCGGGGAGNPGTATPVRYGANGSDGAGIIRFHHPTPYKTINVIIVLSNAE